jgi:glyoxylase-like metal-dependent hydrolase (beta-lactamase superfamily II)
MTIAAQADVSARLAAAGVRRIVLPTPWGIEVNAYLLAGDEPMLVDNGPSWLPTLEALEQGVQGAGLRLDELRRLVLTHHHGDHTGLTSALVERSQAEVLASELAAGAFADPAASAALEGEAIVDVMLRHGADRQAALLTRQILLLSLALGGAPVRVDGPLRDGDEVTAGAWSLRALHRPGHSEADLVYWDERRGVLFVGDHLLRGVSSNAWVVSGLRVPDEGRRRPLAEYRASLEATLELDPSLVLAAHGEPIDDHRRLIRRRLRQQDERCEQLLGLLDVQARSAYALACAHFGDTAVEQPYATISEVLGHLDLLVEAGAVVEDDAAAVTTFAPA